MAGNGRTVGVGDGRVLVGQSHGLASSATGLLVSAIAARLGAFDSFRWAPMVGKSSLIIPSSLQACLDRNKQSIPSAM